jgi:hypothetical protein
MEKQFGMDMIVTKEKFHLMAFLFLGRYMSVEFAWCCLAMFIWLMKQSHAVFLRTGQKIKTGLEVAH